MDYVGRARWEKFMEKEHWYWMFGGKNRDTVVRVSLIKVSHEVRGEEFVHCSPRRAKELQKVHPNKRWRAAQGWNEE